MKATVSSRITGPRAIALTFDDGPNPSATEPLLDLLGRHSACATFFLIGRHVRRHPDLVQQTARCGHALGNHGDSHRAFPLLSLGTLHRELVACNEAIADATGAPPHVMRPPYGLRRPGLRRLAFQCGLRRIVLWSRCAWDWLPRQPAQVRASLELVRGGDVVLLHDGSPDPGNADRRRTIAALQWMLPMWRDEGYTFMALHEPAAPASSAAEA